MLPRNPKTVVALVVLVAQLATAVPPATAATADEIEQKLKALQEQVDTLRKQLEDTKTPPSAPAPVAQPPAPLDLAKPSLLSDFRLGGYGSTRFEASDLKNLNNTFTFRRFVLTGDATIGERLRGLVELEFERFTELEVERNAPSEGGRRGFSQSIEGSDKTELSLEQAWVQFALTDWAKFQTGMILVPLGRFNINHDDNRWDLPRRSLVDRGVAVLPSTAAWSEVGLGFNGDIPTENFGTFNYRVYVMNGVTLDSSIETFARGSGELEAEVEITPRRGTANIDLKRDKAGAIRIAWSPVLGSEIGLSGYYGRYTPDFLPSEPVWAVSIDGKATFGRFELEGEYVRTRFEGINRVVRGFAQSVAEQKLETGLAPLNTTVEFELAGLASTKQGYWLEGRYRFWPAFLGDSILGRRLSNPQLIAVTRWEQVWLDGLVTAAEFTGGAITQIAKDHRFVDRATIGLAYRPVPLVVFQVAFERTWTDPGKSLANVTNFLPARRSEDTANTFLFGAVFGF
jgi:hypothetical protein